MDSSESSDSIEPFPPIFENVKEFKFLGRDWVFTKLAKHLNLNDWTTSKNVVLFLGNIGSGKTTLLRQLIQVNEFRAQTLAYYECEENTDECSFVFELVRQLKNRIPYLKVPTYLQLEKDKQNSKTDYSSNESLFDKVVDQEDDKFFKARKAREENNIFWHHFLFPLIEHGLNRWEGERFLLFIDSVDLKNEIFQLIIKHLHLIPKYLFLILTARPNRQANLFKMFHDSRKIILDDMHKQHILTDMKLYVNHQLERLKAKKQLKEYTVKLLTNQLSIKSNGCYYFIKLFVDYAEKGILNLDSDLNLGCTIYGLFLAVFSKLFDNKDKNTQHFYKSIFALILASQNNQLNRSILNSLFINPLHVDNAIKDLEHHQLIHVSYNEEGDMLINLTNYPIQEWLNDIKLASRAYFSNANFGHLLLLNITPNLSVDQLCYQIDNSRFQVFDQEHKLIWLLLQADSQQFNMLESQASVSETAKEICLYKHKMHRNNSNLDEIYVNMFKMNLFYENLRPQYIEPSKEKSFSLSNLTRNKPNASISAIEQKVLEIFSKLTLNCIEPEEKNEKKISQDYDLVNLLKAIENIDLELSNRILTANSDLVNKRGDDDLTPLFYAIRTENRQLVELLIKFNVDVNQICEDDRQTPLMLAVQLNLIEIVLILLENDADLQVTNIFGHTAIVYAILFKTKPRLIELLLYWGSSCDYLDNDGRSLLSLACVNADSNLEVVRLLFNCGLDVYHRDKFGKSVLHLASVHSTNYELIEYLVEIGREELICIKDNEGKMPIHYAIIYGCNVNLPLLSCERSINSMSLDDCSPLRTAALEFQYDCLHTLIDCCGANVNQLDSNGRTTLYYLCTICNDNLEILDMIKELIKLGANLEICASDTKTTALLIACFKGFEKCVSLLLSAGAELSAVDSEQRNALHLVCASTGNINIMKKLIEHGIEIDAYTSQGATPLIIATQQGQYDACKLLLEYGANVWHRDEYGQNVRDILISCNCDLKMRKLFEKYFGIIGNNEYDVSFDSQQPRTSIQYPEACSPISNTNNNVNLSSTHNLSFNLSVDRDDGQAYSMQGEGRSWIDDSTDNLAYQGSGQNLSNYSPMQSTCNMNYYNSADNLKMNNPLGGSHNQLVVNPKLLSPNCFQRSDSSDLTTRKDKRTGKFARFFHRDSSPFFRDSSGGGQFSSEERN